jgi:RHS repeat-associated protein
MLCALSSSGKAFLLQGDSLKRKNTQADAVLRWDINAGGYPYVVGPYEPGALDITELQDHAGNKYMEGFDSLGKKILERNHSADQTALPLNVYFIYGSNGKFTFVKYVLTPMFMDAYKKGVAMDKNLDMYAYQYEWNLKGHNTAKKLPGQGWSYLIYDMSDKLILYQDANQRHAHAGRWSFNKYDSRGRILMTGVFNTTMTRDELRHLLENGTQSSEERIENSTLGYSTNLTFPAVGEDDINKIYFYDNYTFINKGCFGELFAKFHFADRFSAKSLPESGVNRLTGEMTKASIEQTWLKTALYYDQKDHIIQVVKQNKAGNLDRLSKMYSPEGLPVASEFLHVGLEKLSIRQRFKYSLLGVEVLTYVNNQPPESIKFSYDSLGYLIRKTWADKGSLEYSYETAGEKNRVVRTQFFGLQSESDKVFDMKISYRPGNELKGRSVVSGIQLSFVDHQNNFISYTNSYHYDQASRLLAADQESKNGANTEYLKTENIRYDNNGNILSIRSWLNKKVIDDLSYSYEGNRLIKIDDAGDESMGFRDVRGGRIEYEYDFNGNLVVDKNRKELKMIRYNSANLPEKIYLKDGLIITHSYDADGNELSQTLVGKNKKVKRDFISLPQMIDDREFRIPNMISYLNDRIDRIESSEGFWVREGEKYQFYFYVADHINRIVGVVNNLGRLEEVRNYFPFGEPIFLRSSKSEHLNFQIGVKVTSLNLFSFKFRQYDPAMGRFLSLNVLSELEFQYSPYSYALNNPISNEVVLGLNVDW